MSSLLLEQVRDLLGVLGKFDVKTAAESGRIVWGWAMDENPIAPSLPQVPIQTSYEILSH